MCVEQAKNEAIRHMNEAVRGVDTAMEANSSYATITLPMEIEACNTFPESMAACLQGHRITRRGWNAGGQWVQAQFPDKNSKMSHPYLFIKNAQHDLVPWVPSQGDMFAQDWAIIPIQPL